MAALALAGCDTGEASYQPVDAPAVKLTSTLARQSVTSGTPDPPTILPESCTFVVIPSSAIYLRFDRFLSPASVTRQALCVRPDLADLGDYTTCNGVMIEPSYDPVRRQVTLRLEPGKRWALATTYKVTLFSPKGDGDCNTDITLCGLRAFDGAPLDQKYTFTFTTTDVDPGAVPDDAAPAPDYCGSKGAAAALGACAYSPCHAESDKLGAAEGLDLFDTEGIRATAINHVAHQTQMGEHADNTEVTAARFGRAMSIIHAKSPGDSYLLYKLLVGGSLAAHGKVSESPFKPGDDEIARLRASVVVGLPMPPSEGSSSNLDEEYMVNLSDWIAGGAPTPACF